MLDIDVDVKMNSVFYSISIIRCSRNWLNTIQDKE